MKRPPLSLGILCLLLLAGGLFVSCTAAQSAPPAAHTLTVQNGHFALDGKPFQIISGEMHYPRIPRAYWRTRLKMAKAMGLNAITTYVFWNVHETSPGVYDFSGQNDVAEFVREAQQEGLYVILRPGPYVCAEWEWGGYPAWLLKDRDIVVRSSDPRFIAATTRWFHRLGQELAPLQSANGGPIFAVQVENEYGSFGSDHAYMEQIHHLLLASGFTKALLYTADGPDQVPNGSLPELPAVINFGTGDARSGFETLHRLRPAGPFMNGEYWDGWFDHWGDIHHTTDPQAAATELAWMLKQGYSVSLYMFTGGTSFGWRNGANYGDKEGYQPDTTSYDYDAPLSESGQTTPKYFIFQKAIAEATGTTPPVVPTPPQAQTIPSFKLERSTSLWTNLPAPIASKQLLSMEDLGQAYGYILYRTTLQTAGKGVLLLDGLHDYVQIYANGTLLGTLDRRLKQDRLPVDLAPGTRLDFLVENSGRINYSRELRGERKGILHSVSLAGTPLTGWSIYPLPLSSTQTLPYGKSSCPGPCFYTGTFTSSAQLDTFLETSQFTKGFVWVNGHPLGRIWDIGPQKALYLPGPWLNRGKNEVVVFDLHGVPSPTLQGLDHPSLGSAPAGR
jgi:beta-galactosidase